MWIPNGLRPLCGKCSHGCRRFPTESGLWLSATRKPSHQSAKLHGQVYSHTAVCHQGGREEEGRGKVSKSYSRLCQEPLLVFLWEEKKHRHVSPALLLFFGNVCFSLIDYFWTYRYINIYFNIQIDYFTKKHCNRFLVLCSFASFTAYKHVCSYWRHNTPLTDHCTETHTHTHTHNWHACIKCKAAMPRQCLCLHYILRTCSRHAKCTAGIKARGPFCCRLPSMIIFHWEANYQTQCRLSQLLTPLKVSRPNFNSESKRGDCGGVCSIIKLIVPISYFVDIKMHCIFLWSFVDP